MNTVKPSKKYQAYENIKNLILTHQLIPGQKLVYRDLEEKIGMTKTPIISGLNMLEKEGFVVNKSNRGFYISEIDAYEVEQVFDLREKLENLAIEYAIANCTDENLLILKEKLEEYNAYRSAVYDNKRLHLDTEFHLQIAKMSQNPFFFEIMKQFYEKIYFRLKFVYLTPYIAQFKKEHEMLFKAVAAGNLRNAREILQNHNRACRGYIID
jgi:DNA-binding GntR family transcriptional regulator